MKRTIFELQFISCQKLSSARAAPTAAATTTTSPGSVYCKSAD